jgi:DNA-binding response OmpR family regulator
MHRKIIWADDEIEFLEPHVLYLRDRGFEVEGVTNGDDAIAAVNDGGADMVILDESMPGKDGLETLIEIKKNRPDLPVIMVTKNEEETLMEEAIGFKIDDYLTKPVNPSQILLACKKVLDKEKISEARIAKNFSARLNEIAMAVMNEPGWEEWPEVYQNLVALTLEADQSSESDMSELLSEQISEANKEFGRFIKHNYGTQIFAEKSADPIFSTNVLERLMIPEVKSNEKSIFIVIDGMRLDQWFTFERRLSTLFAIKRQLYYSILPTATPFARNAIFSGLYPADIVKQYPDIYERTEEENSANRYEKELLTQLLARNGVRYNNAIYYDKIFNERDASELEKRFQMIQDAPFTALVFNFVDILAHSRSDLQVLKEIAPDEAAFRSLTVSWFEHSAILSFFKKLANAGFTVYLTSDHGSIRGLHPAKIITDKEASHNLRYKFGRNLKTQTKSIVRLKDPADFRLPRFSLNSECVIATQDYYFVYQQNYHKFASLYKDCFQHGGISLEEMIVPFVKMQAK